MNVYHLLSKLREKNILFELEGQRLKCTAPNGTMTNEILSEIRAAKEEITQFLLECREQTAGGDFRADNGIEPRDHSAVAPLSYAQERFWFFDQLEPGRNVMNVIAALQMEGYLDVAALKAGLVAIVERHEVLRTRFPSKMGVPFQEILPANQFETTVEEIHCNDAEWERAVDDILEMEVNRVFDLVEGPLFTGRILRKNPSLHVLVLSSHHIINDGWSWDIFWRELTEVYNSALQKRPPLLRPLTIQYADYATWQRGALEGTEWDQELNYWGQKLEGPLPLLELPLDYPRPAKKSYRGGVERIKFSQSTAKRILELAQREEVTPFMLILTLFRVLLYQYTGQTDILIGTPVAGRARREVEGLIGLFTNTLVLRTFASPELTLRELLLKERETTLEAFSHQEIPFEKLVEKLHPERDMSRNAIFQVMFSMRRSAVDASGGFEGLETRFLPLKAWNTSKFDLLLSVGEREGSIQGMLEYAADLWDRSTCKEMARRFKVLVENAEQQFDTKIADLPTEEEFDREELIQKIRSQDVPFLGSGTVAGEFGIIARTHASKIAMRCGDQVLTYEQLDAVSERLAIHLQHRGVGPEKTVGLLFERSMEAVVGMLGIVKAGGAYIPLDPNYPQDWIDMVATDSGCNLVLSLKRLFDKVPNSLERIDIEEASGADGDGRLVESGAKADSLIYVMYTSGSTGRPKGVMVEQRGVLRLVKGADYVSMGTELKVPQIAPLTFDAATFEVWAPLLNGGELVVIPGNAIDFAALKGTIDAHRINTAWLTSSLFNAVLDQAPDVLENLKCLLTGGEALSVPHIRKAAQLFPSLQIVNGYGPTECTTFTTTYAIEPSTVEKLDTIPIGKPISNTGVLLMTPQLVPVLSVGFVGEIHVTGPGVARGYLNNPELTEQRFLPNPYLPGERMYKTGDFGRWREDGNLEFLGRKDDQVKIRGFRIELGGIETALARQPGVKAAAAGVRRIGEDNVLCGYVIADEPWSEHEAKMNLAAELPGFLVPTILVRVDCIPLTSSGKLDRRRLAEMEVQVRTDSDRLKPRTPIEETMMELWRDVLGSREFGIRENFFEIGGHSLMAIRLVARVNQLFSVEMPVRAVFEASTVEALCVRVADAFGQSESYYQPIEVAERRANGMELSYGQARLWFLDELEGGSAAYNVPLAVRLKGALDGDALYKSICVIVSRHEVLRSRIDVRGDGESVVVLPEVEFGWNVQKVGPQELQSRVQAETAEKFDLRKGPLLRCTLLQLDETDHVFLATFHHIATDGWSMAVFWRELRLLYREMTKGEPANLPPVRLQYADYAAWHRKWLSGERLASEVQYWKEALKPGWSALEMPADRPRPAVRTYAGAMHSLRLSKELSSKLVHLSHQHGTTLYMTLLAAYRVLLFRYSGQEDVLIGSPIAGRNRPELENLIGFFVNMLVMRNALSAEDSFEQVLKREREGALKAYSHAELPFEMLVDVLSRERDPSRSPLFQAMFVLQTAASQGGEEIEGLEVQSVPSMWATSKYDLNLSMWETGDGLRGSLEYSLDLFSESTIARMLEHFKHLLESVVAHPASAISTLDMMDAQEKHLVLEGFNTTTVPIQQNRTVMDMFAEQVARHPNRTAIRFQETALTYGELDARANSVGRLLRERHHVRSGERVLLIAERGLDMIAALFGIWKIGAVYVPGDAKYPWERTSFVISDCDIKVVLVSGECTGAEQDPAVFADVRRADAEKADYLKHRCSASETAYIIYTSGSTGRPKGVQVTHRSLTNFLLAMQKEPGAGVDDVLLAVTTATFDISLLEFLLPLTVGAEVIIASLETVADPTQLVNLLESRLVTMMQATPVTWNMLLDAGWNGERRLAILCGGEQLPSRLAARMPELGKGAWNMYGPTETTIWSSVEKICPGRPVAIGRPIQNTFFYVLDGAMQPVPIGVRGELYIGGDGVATGYVNREHLTAERFLDNPWKPGGKMYRTGDLARWLEDGRMQCYGRVDSQIKIRGYRIELGEVEAALLRQPGVQDAGACVKTIGELDALCAYVCLLGDSFDEQRFKDRLAKILPQYMLPSYIVRMEELPRTSSGKLDRKSLPLPPAEKSTVQPALTEFELRVSQIWRQVLRRGNLRPDDDFFALGGHSILALRLVRLCEAEFSVALTPKVLFEGATLRAFASRIQDELESKATDSAPSERAVAFSRMLCFGKESLESPLFIVPGAGGDVLPFRELVDSICRIRQVYMLQPKGVDGKARPENDVHEIARDYIEHIRAVKVARISLMGWCAGGIVAFEMARQAHNYGIEVERLVLLDSFLGTKSSLRTGGLLRQKIRRHLGKMKSHGVGAHLAMVAGQQWRSSKRRLARRVCDICLALNVESPIDMRRIWVMDAETEAISKYHLPEYQGNVTFVWADQDPPWLARLYPYHKGRVIDPQIAAQIWQGGCRGEVQHHTLKGDHQSIMTGLSKEFIVGLFSSSRRNLTAVGNGRALRTPV